MNHDGWISIHRKLRDNWVWADASYLKAWIAILMEVNHSHKKILIKGQLLDCNRGQSLKSLSSWGSLFGGWSTKKVRTFLSNLEKDKMIEVESAIVTTRVTVCNYNEYQRHGNAGETQRKRRGNAEETQRKRRGYTNNNDNNENNENNDKKIKHMSDAIRVAEFLFEQIKTHKPDIRANTDKWADDIDKAIRLDGRDPRRLCEVAKWSHTSDAGTFWRSNLLSGKKLRQQFDTIDIQMRTPVAKLTKPGAYDENNRNMME